MKKFILLTTAFIFSIGLMAQNETKSKPVPTKVKVVAPTKVEATKTVPTEVPKATQPAVSQTSPDEVIKMNTINHDFGKIPKGTPVTYAFEIKNISNKPLVLENVSTSCGCTTPEWDKQPIMPGGTSYVKVGYNAANPGAFNKSINITLAGFAQPKTVTIVGEVLAPEPPKEVKTNN